MQVYKIINFIKSIPKAVALRSKTAAWVMFFVSAAMTVWLLSVIKEESNANAATKFNFQAEQIISSIKKRMQTYELALHGGTGLFAASKDVTRKEWKTYVKKLEIEKNYPGILGIGFSKIIKPKNKKDFIKDIKKQGYPNFTIWPEGEREFYTSIVFLEPFKGRNLRAFGYDMYSDSTRRAAMQAARDSNKTTISGSVKLVQETEKDIQDGFLMYEPLYNNLLPIETVTQRRNALKGFVYSPFRMNDLMKGIFDDFTPHLLWFRIYDGTKADSSNLMFTSKNINKTNHKPAFLREDKINLNGHTWTIKFAALPSITSLIDYEKPLIVIIAGSIISLLFLILALALRGTTKLYNKSEQILGSTIEGIFGIDLKNNCTFINKSAVRMIGFNPRLDNKKNIHQIVHDSITDEIKDKESYCPICITLKTKKSFISDNYFLLGVNNNSFPIEYSSNPIIIHNEVKGAVVTFQDITERKKNEQLIKNSLEEKNVLIKEIHHRVKNNMQIISSMLNLQANTIHDKRALSALRESRNRIQSMAIIHEKLYRSGDLSGVKFDVYLKDLITHLKNSYRVDENNIKIFQKIDDEFLGIDSAISIGLIINELLSNIFKHAFKDRRKGEVHIDYTVRNEMPSTLTIKDNGKGFPDNINFEETESLGLQLVNTLVKQLEGKIELNKNGGSEFIITLPNLS